MLINKVISRKGFDWLTFSIYFALVLIGAITLYSVQYDPDHKYRYFDVLNSDGRYLIYIIGALLFFLFAYLIEWRFWDSISVPVYLISIILLFLVLIVGSEIKGARSWFNFAGFSFQPSEFAKMGTALALASYASQHKKDILEPRTGGIAMLIVFLPILLILFQPDAGSALIFTSLFLLFYRLGFPPLIYLIFFFIGITFIMTLKFDPGIVSIFICSLFLALLAIIYVDNKYLKISIILFSVFSIFAYFNFAAHYILIGILLLLTIYSIFLWLKKHENNILLFPISAVFLIAFSYSAMFSFANFLKPHQQDRINVWLNPEKCDPRGSLYNILQAKTAIGSGGLFGKGFLNGNMTHLNFVPEQSTDFIISSIGEEWGFIGLGFVILLYSFLVIRIIKIGERGKTPFITYFAYSLAGYIFMHFIMNIGMNMGILPVIGIPLIFLSKGGTSLLVFSLMMGVLLKMDAERNVR